MLLITPCCSLIKKSNKWQRAKRRAIDNCAGVRLLSIPKIGIAGRHVIILEFAKIGVVVIALPIILVPSVVIASLSYPLIRLELCSEPL